MKIANNIFRDHLKNVYFLCGGAYGGKNVLYKLKRNYWRKIRRKNG